MMNLFSQLLPSSGNDLWWLYALTLMFSLSVGIILVRAIVFLRRSERWIFWVLQSRFSVSKIRKLAWKFSVRDLRYLVQIAKFMRRRFKEGTYTTISSEESLRNYTKMRHSIVPILRRTLRLKVQWKSNPRRMKRILSYRRLAATKAKSVSTVRTLTQ